jgi:hypothetical protein
MAVLMVAKRIVSSGRLLMPRPTNHVCHDHTFPLWAAGWPLVQEWQPRQHGLIVTGHGRQQIPPADREHTLAEQHALGRGRPRFTFGQPMDLHVEIVRVRLFRALDDDQRDRCPRMWPEEPGR